jgi:hypothetical protein
MSTEQSPSTLHQEFAAAGRTYAPDLIATLVLFVSASLMAGRVWRFPYDDELFTLAMAESSRSPLQVLSFYLKGGDVQPPLADFAFYTLYHLGLSEAAMRLCSLAMTALSLVLFHRLTLAVIGERTHATVRPAVRLLALLLFGLSPLAIGVGDAIRWYPLFALLFSLFFTLYLVAGNAAARLGSAVALGLAASTNFLAAIVIAPLLLYRYALQREFRPRFEIAYWLVFSLFGSLGIIAAGSLVAKQIGSMVGQQFENSPFRALASHVLGFFGGDALGVSQAWIIMPVALITAWAMLREIDRTRPADPVHLFLLTFGAMALVVLPGFGKPRSFLYLAPVLAAILTFFLDRKAGDREAGAPTLLASLILIASVAALANINHGTRPFKRNSAIPYEQILDFIQTNEKGNVLIVSSDSVLVWVLRHQGEQGDRCVSLFARETACFAADRRYDSIFVISGQSNRSRNVPFMNRFAAQLSTMIAGRQEAATFHAGLDEDAAIKSRLTETPLDSFILSVTLYR